MGKASASQLVALEIELKVVRELQRQAEQREAEIWDEVYRIFDALDGKDAPARYLFGDGMVLGRVLAKHPQDGAIDTEELQRLCTPEQWKLVTRIVRVFDEKKTVKAAKKDPVISEKIDVATVYKDRVTRKHFRLGTKEERDELRDRIVRVA